jgi:hypothetical protein
VDWAKLGGSIGRPAFGAKAVCTWFNGTMLRYCTVVTFLGSASLVGLFGGAAGFSLLLCRRIYVRVFPC